jgi:hypothetical protein
VSAVDLEHQVIETRHVPMPQLPIPAVLCGQCGFDLDIHEPLFLLGDCVLCEGWVHPTEGVAALRYLEMLYSSEPETPTYLVELMEREAAAFVGATPTEKGE